MFVVYDKERHSKIEDGYVQYWIFTMVEQINISII